MELSEYFWVLPTITTAILTVIYMQHKGQLNQLFAEHNEAKGLNKELADKREKLQVELGNYKIENATSSTQISSLESRVIELKNDLKKLSNNHENLQQEKLTLDKNNSELRQKYSILQDQISNEEKIHKESLQAAKQAMFDSGSSILRKEAENVSNKTLQELQQLMKKMSSLDGRVDKSDKLLDTIWRSLTSPTGAGAMAEIGLENTLKSYGLKSPRDFIMQYSAKGSDGNNLRPDAVVFLPSDNVIVIDSKASKFFVELAGAETEDEEEKILKSLKETMNFHLRSLASKKYKDAVADSIKTSGDYRKVSNIITVMFLPSEAAVEALYKSDSSFWHKTQDAGIVVSGPTGLAGLMYLSKLEISRHHQEQNQQVIIEELSMLLGHIGTVIDTSVKIGRGIESAAKNYSAFTKSVNSRLLPKIRKINQLGVSLPKSKKIPHSLPDYNIVSQESVVIEGEILDS